MNSAGNMQPMDDPYRRSKSPEWVVPLAPEEECNCGHPGMEGGWHSSSCPFYNGHDHRDTTRPYEPELLPAFERALAERDWQTKDSGVREEFDTGSRRDSREGKGRYDLISPVAVARIAGVLERGAAKYGDRNWERGQPLHRYLDSALRHTFQVLAGDRDEDHAAQAVWNLMAYIHTEEKIASGDLPAELSGA